LKGFDGRPSEKTHIRPLTRVMARRLEEEEEPKNFLLSWKITY